MNIDLLIDKNEQAGLVSDTPFEHEVSEIAFDQDKGDLFLRFSNHVAKDIALNIPVSAEFKDLLFYANHIFFGVLEGRTLTDARMVPLKLLNEAKKT